MLAQQQAGDQEPRQHEEHVHADVATAGDLDTGVIEHHQEDGDGAQTFDVRAKRALEPPAIMGHRQDRRVFAQRVHHLESACLQAARASHRGRVRH